MELVRATTLVPIQFTNEPSTVLTELFQRVQSNPDARVAARSDTSTNFEQFFELYHTMMKSTQNGIIAAEGISHHIFYNTVDRVQLEYTGSNYELRQPDIEVGNVKMKHQTGYVEFFVKQPSQVRTPLIEPVEPTTTTLQVRWNFTYKRAYRYSLIKESRGTTRSDACKAQARYFWLLETIPNNKYFMNIGLNNKVKKFRSKVDDLIGRYESNTFTHGTS